MKLGQIERPTVGLEDVATPGGRCPACGEPLFPWIEVDGDAGGARLAQTVVAHVVDRCENCGLATERGDGGDGLGELVEGIVKDVRSDGSAEITIPNGASWQAGLGLENWAGLHLPEVPAVLNPKALDLLLEHEGLKVEERSFPAAAGMGQLMQTLLNLITFNRDFARRALRREITPATARHRGIGYGIDALASVMTAVPVAAISVVVEAVAVLTGHGGILRARITRR
jgi:hypothetical protein